MKSLKEWVRSEPLGRADAVGWTVRLVKALMPLHELDAPHGRINAEAIRSKGPSARRPGLLVDGDENERDIQYYSVQRIKLSGASKEDDVWATGVLLYYMVTGAYPFPGTHRRQVRERIEWRPASPIEVYGVEDPKLQALLDRLFKPDEALRLTSLKLLLRALLKLEPDAEGLGELGYGVLESAEEEPPPSDEVPSSRDPVKVVADIFGSGEVDKSPLALGDLPRGPLPTLQGALSDDAKASILDDAEPPEPVETPAVFEPPFGDQNEEPPPEAAEEHPLAASASANEVDEDDVATRVRDMPRLDDEDEDLDREPAVSPTSRPPSAATSLARPERVDEALKRATTPSQRPPGQGTGFAALLWGIVILLGVAAIALYAVPGLGRKVASLITGRSSSPAATGPAPAFTSKPPPVAAPSPSPSAVAPSPTPTAAPPKLVGRDACVAEMLPGDTFAGGRPKFAFMCTEESPRKAIDKMRIEIVLGKGTRTVTPAMELWTELGWYQMAFVAAARARCCPDDPPPMKSELGGPPCRFDDTLSDLGFAASEGDDEHLDKALADFESAVNCLARAPTETTYGFANPPSGSEAVVFKKLIVEVRAKRP